MVKEPPTTIHVVDRMLALGYQGFITVELSPQDDTSTIPDDLRLAKQMFEKYEASGNS